MERVAAIDVGTNTIRMLVSDIDRGKQVPVARMRKITALGKSLRETGTIGKTEFKTSIGALAEFADSLRRLGVGAFRACGTAGLREAENRGDFLDAAKRAGIGIDVISAEEEAFLAWSGMLRTVKDPEGILLMDIGGGSTEFAVGPGPGESVSLPIGVVVLCGSFELSDPPAPWQLAGLQYYLSERIEAGTSSLRRRRIRRLVGTAGTFTTLAALEQGMKKYLPEKIDGFRMGIDSIRKWSLRLASLKERRRLSLAGMEKGRERYIVPGTMQALTAMELFGVGELVVSDAGILEGIIDEIAATRKGEQACRRPSRKI